MSTLTPGCRLSRKHHSRLAADAKVELDRLEIDGSAIIHATFVDATGVSVNIQRGWPKPDIRGFIPNSVNDWTTYFDAGTLGNDGANPGYRGVMHAKQRFPKDF